MKFRKILPLFFAGSLLSVAQASVIYQATTNNINTIENTVNGTTTQSESGGVLTVTQNGNGNYNGGFASSQDIDTLLGRPLLATETVRLQLTVDSMNFDLSANGFEFGLSPNGTAFRPGGHLIFQIRPNDQIGSIANNAFDGGTNNVGFGLTEASVLDGFSGTLLASQSGYTFSFQDVVLSSGAAATYSGTFASPAEFQSVVGGGHFYTTSQKAGTPNPASFDISVASIDVIPEPSSIGLGLLGAVALFVRQLRHV